MHNRTLEGWRTHKPLNKQILSPFQRQWGKILGDWCKTLLSWCWLQNAESSGMLVTCETISSVLSWDTQCFDTLTATDLLAFGCQRKIILMANPFGSQQRWSGRKSVPRNHLGCAWGDGDQTSTCKFDPPPCSGGGDGGDPPRPICIPSSAERLWPRKTIFVFKYFQPFLRDRMKPDSNSQRNTKVNYILWKYSGA